MAKARKETFTRWDPADHFRNEADMVAYLQACLEENDPQLLAAAIGDIARARGMMELAKKTGLTREGLYQSLSKTGNPSLATIMKVMQALGLKLTAKAA